MRVIQVWRYNSTVVTAEGREDGEDENEIEENLNIDAVETEEQEPEPEENILSRREGVVATQSSEGWSGVPGRAIDGDHTSVWSGGSCTHTQNTGTSWWKLDLGESSPVKFVRITNRAAYGERLEGAVIRVGDSETIEENPECSNAITTFDIRNGPTINKFCRPNTAGRYVSVHVDNFLTLCEVEVFSSELLSEGRHAIQSSLGWGGIPGRAVDGSRSTNYNHNSCTHTERGPVNWWMVDLGNSYSIQYVRIHNRGDCCRERLNGATIRVGDNYDGMLTNAQCGEPIADADTSASSVIDRQCNPPLDGRYVSVAIEVDTYLTLCEVEVWGQGDLSRPEENTETGLLSSGRPTAQSSTGWQGLSLRGVDGDYRGRYGDRTCTHTRKTHFRYVRLKNREDCCFDRLNNAQVRVGDSEDVLSNAECGEAFTMEDINVPSPFRICNGDDGVQGRYVSVNVNNYLTLCEVEVFNTLPIAFGGVASQSSVGWGGVAGRAIDNRRTMNYGQNSCTHTQNEPNSWWMVDLQETFDINLVRMYNREDCCRDRLVGAVVRVSLQEESQSGDQCGEPVSALDISRDSRISRECSLNGRYVSVTVSNYLTLCEVEVFGLPDAATVAAREAAAAEAARLLEEAERAAEEARQRAEAEAAAEAQRILEETRGIRLVGGASENEGRVEIFANGGWGTVCDDYWDILDGAVACRQMGYQGLASSAPMRAEFGQGDVPILLDDVTCSGSENRLTDCPNLGIGRHNCAHSEDAGVVCNTGNPPSPRSSSEPTIRLVGGSGNNEGRVEVYINGYWGTVCDDGWGINDANVVCRELDFTHGAQDALQSAHFGQGDESFPILLDDVACSGTESDLLSCGNIGIGRHNCGHSEDASVICNTMAPAPDVLVRLAGTPRESEGRVEVWSGGRWGTVCDDYWSMEDANVVCRYLGFTEGAREAPMQARFGVGSGDIILDDVRCSGSESSIFDCSHTERHNCGHHEDASVICVSNHGSAGDVRLVGGGSEREGRVEINLGGRWGTVCDDYWDINDAHVVCNQLGQGRAREAVSRARFGQGSDDILLDNVGCGGSESSLIECSNIGIGQHNCAHSEDAGVICIGPQPNSQLRLVGGGNSNEGRVEINVDGEWGTVCDDYWDMSDARVVCRQLGKPEASDAPQRARFGRGSGPIVFDNVQCAGTESDLAHCANNGRRIHNCGHHEDASVVCGRSAGNVRLVGGGSEREGRVEINHGGRWGTVCDDYWDINDAHVVCNQLGQGRAREAVSRARFGQGSGDILLDNVGCGGSESSLIECSNIGIGRHNCAHSEDAGVICIGR
ncbi:antigen WC1.1-like [Anneissia japonica]|uniref:antigen WC1.1-like n=1 Tax=Anneissia japonica TaxID=1529436 RepID=UPI00142586C1|nr:antigen WC1.1-like [Anneissia japonica]